MNNAELVIDQSGRHHVVTADRAGWPAARKLLLALRANGCSSEFIRPRTALSSDRITEIFSRQTMGMRLYIAGLATFVAQVRAVGREFGLSREEQSVLIIGPPAPFVFCIACYHRFEHPGSARATCTNCGQQLEVTNHVSDRLQAVMGSIALSDTKPKEDGEREDNRGQTVFARSHNSD